MNPEREKLRLQSLRESANSPLLRIDPDNLDMECIIQPEILEYFGKLHVLARAKSEATKRALEWTKADLEPRIREGLISGGEKATAAVVEAKTIVHPSVATALKESMEADADQGKAWVAYEAAKTRGNMLDNMVKLWNSQYFGQLDSPDIRRERAAAIETRMASIRDPFEIPAKPMGEGPGKIGVEDVDGSS